MQAQPAPSTPGAAPAASTQASTQNPLRPATAPTTPAAQPDRYGLATPSAATAAPPNFAAPSQSIAPAATETTFAASWPAIQAALDRGDLKQAHQLLSKWHGNETLSPAESEKVETLLGQLAGTVIYSTAHQLEPARVVKPGETLDTIAKEYNVTPTLLAKINGVASPDQLRAGQELKVVRGPFSAVVDLRRSEVTLMVDERYAGKYHVTVPPGGGLTDGQWVVDQKIIGPASTANPGSYATTPVPADRTIILRNATAANPSAGSPTLLIASGPPPVGLATNPPALRVTPQDAEELSDILLVGSRVVVRR
jgi:LysM repeat protein